MPASATPRRRFCSSPCRLRGWDRENPPPDDDRGAPVRLHWHHRASGFVLYRDLAAGYWRGEGCPPECDGKYLEGPGAWSTGIPDGMEGRTPYERSAWPSVERLP